MKKCDSSILGRHIVVCERVTRFEAACVLVFWLSTCEQRACVALAGSPCEYSCALDDTPKVAIKNDCE